MINVFFESAYWGGTNRMTGPRAVIRNLFESLEQEKVPYAINEEKYKYNFLVQYDRNGYLKHSKLNLENCFIGPQIWFFDEHTIELQQHPERYKAIVVPSEWTKDKAVNKFGFGRVDIWPVGIPLLEVNRDVQFDCLVYSKRRTIEELQKVVQLLENRGMTYKILSYGNYNEEEFHQLCQQSKFCFLINGTESQGIAVQEVMSFDTPIIGWDVMEWSDMGSRYTVPATSLPYWSPICGEKFYNEDEMEETFERFYSNIEMYNPRKYVQENLSYKTSVNRLLEILTFGE